MGIAHTEIVDIVEAGEIAHIDPLVRNLAAHRVHHQVDCHIPHRSAHQEHSDDHNSRTVRLQEPVLPEGQSAGFVRSSYKKVSFQKLLYYRMDRNVVREEMLQREHFVPVVHGAMHHNAYKMLPQVLLPHYSVDRTGLPIEKARQAVVLLSRNEGKISYQ
jgi:hypothetical protein